MSFNKFDRIALMDEATGDPQGGAPATPAQPTATPAFDPAAFRNELKTELLNEFRKDINGIDKKFKKEFETFNGNFSTAFSGLKSELQSWLKPAEPSEPSAPEPVPAVPVTPANTAQPQTPAQPQGHKPSPTELALKKQVEEMKAMMDAQKAETEKARSEAAKKE